MKKLLKWVLAGMATTAGKLLMTAIVGAFALVLIVVPRGGESLATPSEAAAEPTSLDREARGPAGLDRGPPVVTTAPPTTMIGPEPDPWLRDSLAVCDGLSAWQSRFGEDSLTADLQASLERLRLRCGMIEDSTE